MQRDKTLRFWDDYHTASQEESSAKEWILQPSPALLDAIGQHVVSAHGGGASLLEIGCGSSCLSRDLWKHLHRICENRCHVLATDVSSVCVEQNRNRDQETIRSSHGSFDYKVLNVLEANETFNQNYNVILDKGCLDTFMFRSQQRGPKARAASPLVRSLLDNVHSWLDSGGKYICLTPRSRIRAIRDYAGFSSVTKVRLDPSTVVLGDLDGDMETEQVFMHICTKNNEYKVGQDDPFPSADPLALDHKSCPSCGTSFDEFFRVGKDKKSRNDAYWARRWNGHCVHCKGSSSKNKTCS